MEYYMTIQKEVLPFAAAWMDMESLIVCEISQSKKYNYDVISLTCEIY